MTSRLIKQHELVVKLLKKHEGLRLMPYEDSEGLLTIGYGRCLDRIGITLDEAEMLLQNDISDAEEACEKHLDYFPYLDPVRQSIVTNMVFNLGMDGFLKFKRLNRAIRARDWGWATREMMDSKWAKQVKSRAEELSWMMLYGRYKNE